MSGLKIVFSFINLDFNLSRITFITVADSKSRMPG